MVAVRFVFLPVILVGVASAQINSIFNSITSDAGSIFSQATSAIVGAGTEAASDAVSVGQVITSAADDIEEVVTSAAGSIFTVITSDGGKAITLGENGIGTIVTDLTQFYASATSELGAIATGTKHANGNVAHLHNQRSMALFASLGTVAAGVAVGARMVL